MNIQSVQLGELTCQLVDELPPGKSPEMSLLLCHGYGAPGNDLVGLGPELLKRSDALRESIQFVFPAAPLSLDALGMYDARAWWHLDVMAISAAIQQGELRDLRSEIPEGLPEAREMLMGALHAYCEQWNLPISKMVLGGFSQGSMIATDVAIRLPESPAGLAIFSGTLLMEDEWSQLAEQCTEMSLLQSHGMQDEILPYCGAEWLRDMFTTAGLQVDFCPVSGRAYHSHSCIFEIGEDVDSIYRAE